ncbi:hypothetical protein GCM10017581_045560 [Dactylosporangium matsuzakiense]|uniref:HTH araC/xylS-type domain-containing protein n=1 Tax=Dactylosporangium matsuzakiense TaxID=53360 RepID=A0A9W6KNZ4_9ACTN|nr:hypothetical protein GCM10017581_045560 [Dactylosporangium matsuzakiense]
MRLESSDATDVGERTVYPDRACAQLRIEAASRLSHEPLSPKFRPPHYEANHTLDRGARSIADAAALGISERHLRRCIRTESGYGPQTWLRIVWLERLLAAGAGWTGWAWRARAPSRPGRLASTPAWATPLRRT